MVVSGYQGIIEMVAKKTIFSKSQIKAFTAQRKKDLAEARRLHEKERLLEGLPPRVQVMSEWLTLDELLKGKSIARFGDGEIKHMDGKRNVSQIHHPELTKRLNEVFRSRLPNLLIGIPNVYNGREFTEVNQNYINNMERRFRKIADKSHLYASSYITRGDLCGYLAWPSYWSKIFELWTDRDVTLIRGHDGRATGKGAMLAKARSVHHIETPISGAWKDYDRIFREAMLRPESDLFLLCIGPTATILAHDLALKKRQALDIGHLGMFYSRHWGIEDDRDRQIWHHRPTDPNYLPGSEY